MPFRPDYVSTSAVDLMAKIVQDKASLDALAEVAFSARRYVTLANYVGAGPKDQVRIGDIAAFHPIFQTQLPFSTASPTASSSATSRARWRRYGAGVQHVRRLYTEVVQRFAVPLPQPAAPARRPLLRRFG